jgi:DedD protein
VSKPAEKAVEKPADKPKADDAKRAAAILAGQTSESKAADSKQAAKGGEYLVLIGAFSNEANVKNLKEKLSEQGIKTFSEPLDTPQGKKTRVRAGPFTSREAAEKALEKMQRIGVSGVVSAKP